MGDTIALATRSGDLILINPASGEELGRCSTEEGGNSIAAVFGTPAWDGERLYIGGYDGAVYAIDPTALQPREEEQLCNLLYDPNPQDTETPFVGGATIIDDTILIGSEAGLLYALDKETGQPQWSVPFSTDGQIWSTPAVSNGIVYIGTLSGAVHAVRIGDRQGTEIWRFNAEAGIGSVTVVDGVVYATSFDQRLYALDAATGAARWAQPFKAQNWFWGGPLVHQGRLYAPSLDHNLYILDAATGVGVFEPIRTGGAIRGTPTLIGGRVVIANEADETWWIDPNTGIAQAGGKLPSSSYAPILSLDDVGYVYTQNNSLYRIAPNARQPVQVYPLN